MFRWLSVVALVLTTAGAAQAGEFVVSPSGSDAAPGTLAQPWRTLNKGLASLLPGDTLYVRGGLYRERIKRSVRQATATAPIQVRAYPNERPVLQGLLWVSRPSYWSFNGLNVTWDTATGLPTEHLVKITNGVGWSFTHAEVWGARSYAGILVASTLTAEPRNWRIAENVIHDTYKTNNTNQDHLIYVNSGLQGSGGVIERNLLYNALNGEGVKLGGPSATSGGTAGVTIRYNTIYNTAQAILIAWQSHSNQVYRNILMRVGTNYAGVRGYQATGLNNVAYDNLVFQARGVLLNDPGYMGVRNGGGNLFPVDPLFETMDLWGFYPLNPTAAAYGRYAEVEGAGDGGF